MGNGLNEWPLVLFTVLGQCVVGGIIVAGLAWLSSSDKQQKQQMVRPMILLWLLMGLGFLASTLHMGSPFRALNSMNRIFQSPLSNEVLFGAIFFALGGVWWLLSFLRKMPESLGKIWLLLTMVIGLVFIWLMTRVYLIDTVPTWNTPYTTINFFMTVLLTGPIIGTLILRLARFNFNSSKFAFISVIAFVISIATIISQSLSLSEITTSVQKATELIPDYASLQVVRVILIFVGLLLWIYPLLHQQKPQTLGLTCGLLLILIGELIGRTLFYGLHMTVGMAVAG